MDTVHEYTINASGADNDLWNNILPGDLLCMFLLLFANVLYRWLGALGSFGSSFASAKYRWASQEQTDYHMIRAHLLVFDRSSIKHFSGADGLSDDQSTSSCGRSIIHQTFLVIAAAAAAVTTRSSQCCTVILFLVGFAQLKCIAWVAKREILGWVVVTKSCICVLQVTYFP